MKKVQFKRGISLNGTWYKKDQKETFSKQYAEALEAKGIVKAVPVDTAPAKTKEEAK